MRTDPMEIYDRQIRAFGEKGQKIIQGLSVAVAGVGGIGSLLVVLLVRLGVRCIVLIDPDVVELSNLNRLAGATQEDALKRRPKVEVLARYAATINPHIKVIPLQKSIFDNEAQHYIKMCDVVFGGLDNQSGRWILNKLSIEHLIPYFDTGTGIKADAHHNIEHAGGQVCIVIPGMGCLNCIGAIKVDIAQQEMLPEPDRQVAQQLGYIDGADVRAPAVASLNGVIANLAATEFMAFVTGFRPLHRYIRYDLMKARVTAYTFNRDPNCFTCSPLGSLAVGDHGTPLPVELLIDEPQPPEESKGEPTMQEQVPNTKQAIAELLSNAEQKNLAVEGSPDGQWFLIKNAKLGKPFKRPRTQVMVKFVGASRDPIILIPDTLEMAADTNICPNFLSPTPCLKGWKPLCPHMFRDVAGELFQFIACLTGFLGNPNLCGLMGCEGRALAQRQP